MDRREKFTNLIKVVDSLREKIEISISDDKWYSDKREYCNLESNIRSLREISALLKVSEDYVINMNDDIDFFCNITEFCDNVFNKIISKEPNESTIKLLKFIEQTNGNFDVFKSALLKFKEFKSKNKNS